MARSYDRLDGPKFGLDRGQGVWQAGHLRSGKVGVHEFDDQLGAAD